MPRNRLQTEAENLLEHQKGADGLVGIELVAAQSPVIVVVVPFAPDLYQKEVGKPQLIKDLFYFGSLVID